MTNAKGGTKMSTFQKSDYKNGEIVVLCKGDRAEQEDSTKRKR